MTQQTTLSQLSVVVVGAGFGGLAAGIELASRGAKVTVFESYHSMKKQGDVIQIPANATRLIAKWGDVLERIVQISVSPDTMTIMNNGGRVLLNQVLHTEFEGFPNIYGNRGKIQQAFADHAASVGVDIRLGTTVTHVSESADGVSVHVDDQEHKADVVIAADGVHSKSRSHVMGVNDRPKKSGFAVYRSWFSLELLENDPLTEEIATCGTPLFQVWIAENSHAILTTNPPLKAATCFITHKDLSDVAEDWNQRGDVRDMLACAQGWDEKLRHIIEKIPADCLVDYKLLWRDPVAKWVSDQGRVCLLGDAAHPHLATSGTGAAQAIEDAATIGALFEKNGVEDVKLVLQAYQKLRYERTSLTQRMGWETRHVWHQTDWDAVAANPDVLQFPQPSWLLGSDATQYAKDNFEGVKASIENGTSFKSQNIPPGHVHEDWTVETMLEYEGGKVGEGFYQTRAITLDKQ